ncbi:hypothetical protein ACS127_00960 [Amphibacillus sp. Q70]|uniref:hypothetical protein n=1 Tax=Amphibacillus sp. Q70 TaxID=3453416 RepID=UPI003F866E33
MMDKNLIRKKNLAQVKALLFKNGRLFASDLVKQTNISMVTINSLLKELINDGVVQEGELTQREMGRPAIEYIFNADYSHAMLLSIQEKKPGLLIKMKVVNLKGDIQTEATIDFSEVTRDRFKAIIAEQLSRITYVDRMGVLFPGKINQGVVQSSWNTLFDGWDMNELIGSVTDLPFFIQNDAHLITIGHCIKQNISFSKTIVGIFYPQQSMPGVTLFTEGKLIEGNHSLAGEAKYLPTLISKPSPESNQDLVERLAELLPFYNAAIAPEYFIISSDGVADDLFLAAIDNNKLLKRQPNQAKIEFVSNFQECITLGLRWLVYQNTAFDLSIQ